MSKEKYEKILDHLGVHYVKSQNVTPLTKEELNKLNKQLSQTNFNELIDNRHV